VEARPLLRKLARAFRHGNSSRGGAAADAQMIPDDTERVFTFCAQIAN
jgi:hypothetical protein